MKYQLNYSKQFPATKDKEKRYLKAGKILSSFQDYYPLNQLTGKRCLDMGCSIGAISSQLVEFGIDVVGLDLDYQALFEAKRNANGAKILAGDVEANPFKAEEFDLIVCSQVYEHTPDIVNLISEIYRVLKPKGVCFFSGPNRWALMEDHYHLPFLSWFPKRISNTYVKIMGVGSEYYEHPVSARYLRSLLRNFTVIDLTSRILKDPARYSMKAEVGFISTLAGWMPNIVWPLIGTLVPNFNWLIVKE